MARINYHVTFEPLRDDARAFLSATTGIPFDGVDFTREHEWFCCTVYDPLKPVIVIVFEFKSPFDAFATVAVSDQRGLSRHLLTSLFKAVFTRATRITALVSPGNRNALRQVGRMGFRQEGYQRRAYDGVNDAVVFGLLPEECPYLLGGPFRFRTVTVTHETVQRIQ